jgi:hypothetical protein
MTKELLYEENANPKFLAQLEFIVNFAEFSTPVTISKRIAFKYIQKRKLTRTDSELQLLDQFNV